MDTKKERMSYYKRAVLLLAAFVLFTLLLRIIDVKPIGPEEESVGMAGINQWFFHLLGGEAHSFFYTATEWLGNLAIAVALGFAVLGLCQLIHRKGFSKVDSSLYALAMLYICILFIVYRFELFSVNYRPVMLDERLEPSYPSTHTVVAVCVFYTAFLQLRERIRNPIGSKVASGICLGLMGVTVLGRVAANVHWFTDFIGGLLLSAALISLYRSMTEVSGARGGLGKAIKKTMLFALWALLFNFLSTVIYFIYWCLTVGIGMALELVFAFLK